VQGNKAARRRAAMNVRVPVLAEHARANGRRFLLFQSAARGRMTCDSDVNTILGCPQDRLSEVRTFAATALLDHIAVA
jgi:hypothetical protein